MTFDLPNLTAFLTVFFVVATVATVIAVSTLVSFFSQNHKTRVRRHESVGHYYGHLVLGH
jgi:hypothetical protein